MKIVEIPIKDLKPAPYNPRIITKEEFEGLKHSLKTFGFVDPAIINKDYTIIGGHRRVEGWEALGHTTAPCIVLDLDKKQEKKLNVLLNSQAISGKYDQLKLDEILEELNLESDYEELRLDKLESKKEEEEAGAEEFTTELLEENNYIVFTFDNNIDWLQASDEFEIQSVLSLDSKEGYERKGIGRVVKGNILLKKINGLRDSNSKL